MIQIPAILREIASSGGSLYEKGPPSIAVLHLYGKRSMLWEGALQFYIETADHMTSEPRDLIWE